jgi:NADH dehydrogenase FAD-containing subunit
LRDYPNLPIEKAAVHLYEMGPHLLMPFKPHLEKYAQKALEDRGARVNLGERVVVHG